MNEKKYYMNPENDNPSMLKDDSAVAYGTAAYETDVDVLDAEDTTADNPEWEEVFKQSIVVGIEQIERGMCHTAEEVHNRIWKKYGLL